MNKKTGKIRFEDLGRNRWLISAYLLIIMLLFGDIMLLFPPELAKEVRIAKIIAYVFLAISFSRIFLFKNYVQWNKSGINIKLNGFLYQNYAFNNIQKVNFKENSLEIIDLGGKTKTYDISDINLESKTKLLEILKKHLGKSSITVSNFYKS